MLFSSAHGHQIATEAYYLEQGADYKLFKAGRNE